MLVLLVEIGSLCFLLSHEKFLSNKAKKRKAKKDKVTQGYNEKIIPINRRKQKLILVKIIIIFKWLFV